MTTTPRSFVRQLCEKLAHPRGLGLYSISAVTGSRRSACRVEPTCLAILPSPSFSPRDADAGRYERRCFMSSHLPLRANLEWLKKLCKERLATLRKSDPSARLSDAQLAVAREF